MSEQGNFKPPEANEAGHSRAELDELYNYLIDTYGENYTRKREDYPILDTFTSERPELPQLTGVAAVKAAIFGDKRPSPEPAKPTTETYTETDRIVDIPILPARNPNDVRRATLLRRQSTKSVSRATLFQSWSERSEAEADARGINAKTVDTAPTGVLYRSLGESKIETETGSLWFDYLSKVKEYRDSGLYERDGYAPFIEQNRELIAAMEQAMGFTENDREIRLASKRQYDQEQLGLEKQFIDSWLADLAYSEWEHVPDYSGSYRDISYDQRSRGIQISSPTDSSQPTLSVTEVQTKGAVHYPNTGIVIKYSLRLSQGDAIVASSSVRDNLSPDIPYPQNVQEVVNELANGMITSGVLDDQTVQNDKAQIAELNSPLSIPADEQSRILLRTLWNEVMKKYSSGKPEGSSS